MGIFPWYSHTEPIIWWSPDPRFILETASLKISKSMRQVLRRNQFRFTFDQAFSDVITQCKQIYRKDQSGTWITNDMLSAYEELHRLGFAHSVEVWENEQLVGGLYGISLGHCFFGESMFANVSNASKAGFITLVQTLEKQGFTWIDCQVHTDHLETLGAEEIPREEFLSKLEIGLTKPTYQGNWQKLFLS
ncbi:UNVERIFIED_CONTAM: hypothetical protein GTU68_047979 [Idotea baltica]|nr:hypothetical protein [Idotea baltica]